MTKNTENLISLPLERNVLSGLLKFPNVFPEIDVFLNEFDFFHKVHQIIYSITKSSYIKGEKIDKTLISQKIINLGITHFEAGEVGVFDYISNLMGMSQITENGSVLACKELIKLRIRREIIETCENIKEHVVKNGNSNLDEIIAKADAIYNGKMDYRELDNQPENIFENAEQIVEERGNNPIEDVGFSTPFPEFNKSYGSLLPANIYAVSSRSGSGKTSLLNWLSYSMCVKHSMPVLSIDTEMSTEEVRFRLISAISNVPLFLVMSGKWRQNKETEKLVRKVLPILNKIPFYHYHVGDKSIEEVGSIMRRWKYSKAGRNNKSLLTYDYLKLGSEKLGNLNESQHLGAKTSLLKRISEELDSPMLTACQANRAADTFNKKGEDALDDSSGVFGSDKILHIVSMLMIFRQKTLDEIQRDGGIINGSHKGIVVKARTQGYLAPGHSDYLKRKGSKDDKDGKYVRNYINFSVDNFRVEERGTLKDIIAQENDRYNVQAGTGDEALL